MNTLGMDFPRRETRFTATHAGFSVVLKRNCSISPRGLLLVFALLAALALTIASVFAALGAWLILPFAGLEIALLGAAFWFTARHATDYERIERARERLTVEVSEAERLRQFELDARRARVQLRDGRVLLDAPRAQLEVGRHLDAEARAGFAAELGKRLQS
ncbi:MAG: DUF2244 domain-containing protein [Burkholderiales bacterium]